MPRFTSSSSPSSTAVASAGEKAKIVGSTARVRKTTAQVIDGRYSVFQAIAESHKADADSTAVIPLSRIQTMTREMMRKAQDKYISDNNIQGDAASKKLTLSAGVTNSIGGSITLALKSLLADAFLISTTGGTVGIENRHLVTALVTSNLSHVIDVSIDGDALSETAPLVSMYAQFARYMGADRGRTNCIKFNKSAIDPTKSTWDRIVPEKSRKGKSKSKSSRKERAVEPASEAEADAAESMDSPVAESEEAESEPMDTADAE